VRSQRPNAHERAGGEKHSGAGAGVITAICLSLAFDPSGSAQAGSSKTIAEQKGAAVAAHARGTFEVQMNPRAPEDKAEGASLGRLSLDKRFHGDLEATGKGETLTAVKDVKGSAGYVAIERITGTLHGRSGSFVLLHRGIMTNRGQELTLTVVPDSGVRQLVGLAGEMAIQIADGKHSYDLAYTLPKVP
jgi:uncharacterized protein DUF3224